MTILLFFFCYSLNVDITAYVYVCVCWEIDLYCACWINFPNGSNHRTITCVPLLAGDVLLKRTNLHSKCLSTNLWTAIIRRKREPIQPLLTCYWPMAEPPCNHYLVSSRFLRSFNSSMNPFHFLLIAPEWLWVWETICDVEVSSNIHLIVDFSKHSLFCRNIRRHPNFNENSIRN